MSMNVKTLIDLGLEKGKIHTPAPLEQEVRWTCGFRHVIVNLGGGPCEGGCTSELPKELFQHMGAQSPVSDPLNYHLWR